MTAIPNPTPPAPAPTPSSTVSASVSTTTPKQTASTSKVGTNLNPVPQAQEPASASKTDPQRVDPPIMALEDKTQAKIETPSTQNNEARKIPWLTYAEISGAGILAIGFIAFIKFKYLKA